MYEIIVPGNYNNYEFKHLICSWTNCQLNELPNLHVYNY